MISNTKQLPLGLIGEVRQIKDLPYEEVARCSNPYQAVRLCIRTIPHDDLAYELGVKQGTFANIVNRDLLVRKAKREGRECRVRNIDLSWISTIQRLAGNRAIAQYFDYESKGQLFCQLRKEQELTIEEKAALYDQGMTA